MDRQNRRQSHVYEHSILKLDEAIGELNQTEIKRQKQEEQKLATQLRQVQFEQEMQYEEAKLEQKLRYEKKAQESLKKQEKETKNNTTQARDQQIQWYSNRLVKILESV